MAAATAALPLGSACQQVVPATPPREPRPTPLADPEPTRRGPGAAAGDPIVVMLPGEPETLDPAFRGSAVEQIVAAHVFDSLTRRDPRTLRIVPEVVREWQAVDERTWDLVVPRGARFHDGTPIDAEAVAFSLARQARAQIGGKPTTSTWGRDVAFASTEAVGGTTVRLRTRRPMPIVPDLLAAVELVPPSQLADDAPRQEVGAKPIGSGPYRIAEWIKDDRLVLEAFDGHRGSAPGIKTVVFKPVPNPATRTLALLGGKADLIPELPPDQIPIVERSVARAARAESGRTIVVGMRVDRPLLADRRVRQALNHAFDFGALNRTRLGGLYARAATVVNPPHEPEGIRPFAYDPERARALLAEVGWTPGPNGLLVRDERPFSVTLDAPSGRHAIDGEIARALQQDLRQVGIQLQFRTLDWPTYVRDILPHGNQADLFLYVLDPTFSGQEELRHLSPDSTATATHWQNEEFTRGFQELATTIDASARRALIDRLVTIAREDPPWILVCRQVDVYGVSRRLAWEPSPTGQIRLSEARLSS